MKTLAIFYPVFALAGWTMIVLLLVPIARIGAARRGELSAKDFAYGESSAVPGRVRIPNRAYMNLLEIPVLFYVVCMVLYATAGASTLAVLLAWLYVALRVVHSAIHLTYNNVLHRLFAFVASNVVLLAIWVVAGRHVLG